MTERERMVKEACEKLDQMRIVRKEEQKKKQEMEKAKGQSYLKNFDPIYFKTSFTSKKQPQPKISVVDQNGVQKA